jgi:hypothetical protein
MTHFNQHTSPESYADLNVATSDDDLLAWMGRHGPFALLCIRRAMADPSNDIKDCDALADKIQAGHWEFLRIKWRAWRADQDETDQHQADIEATDESLRRWFCWQATH